MSSDWSHLLALAESEVNRTIQSLPSALRDKVRQVPVSFESRPDKAYSELGTTTDPLPAQIILFLENIRDAAEGDEAVYQEEVRATLLHELGHYLGLDETDLEERGLD